MIVKNVHIYRVHANNMCKPMCNQEVAKCTQGGTGGWGGGGGGGGEGGGNGGNEEAGLTAGPQA